GYYEWSATDANLTQASLTVTHGAANIAKAAHAGLVAAAAGSVTGGGVVSIVVSGTSMDDEGNRSAADSETIVSNIESASTDEYFETVKKWIGTITYTLTVVSGSPSAYSFDFNYGFSKYDDFHNQDFTMVGIELEGNAGANDTGFNIRVIHHNSADWTYAASGFVPGPTAGDATELANMNTDYNTETDLFATSPGFAYERLDLNTDISGSTVEGVLVEITTGAAKAVEELTCHIDVHTAPNFIYLSSTKQHVQFMYHGGDWLEL
ncbi:hypothetical protein LCGC14_3038890, partial [marine sediment metagenome]